jgi:hypothetical protein
MKKYNFAFLYCLVVVVCFVNCKNKKDENDKKQTVRFLKEGRFLIKETYNRSGKISIKQYFNKDTTPNGAYIEYFDNGNICKWVWYIPNRKNPKCGVYFHSDGSFDTLKGRPYLGIAWDEIDDPVVKLINPPHLTIQFGYKEIYKNHILRYVTYDPILTDSISWVPLHEYKYAKGHKYKIYFCIVDTIQKRFLYQDSTNLAER